MRNIPRCSIQKSTKTRKDERREEKKEKSEERSGNEK